MKPAEERSSAGSVFSGVGCAYGEWGKDPGGAPETGGRTLVRRFCVRPPNAVGGRSQKRGTNSRTLLKPAEERQPALNPAEEPSSAGSLLARNWLRVLNAADDLERTPPTEAPHTAHAPHTWEFPYLLLHQVTPPFDGPKPVMFRYRTPAASRLRMPAYRAPSYIEPSRPVP